MIERQTIGGRTATVAYLTGAFIPATPDTAQYVKVLFDDGETLTLTLTNPSAPQDVVSVPTTDAEPLEPGSHDDDEEHEHDAVAWAKHQRRMGQPKTLKIHGHELAHWARNIAAQDAQRIHTAISVGLTAGEDNTDIAHRVIGSRRLNGSNGMTEITRQHILSLGKRLLHTRKTRMRGA